MGIRVYKPTTNGRRNMTSLDFAEITTSTPEKSLLVSLKSKAGRNNNGRITVRHQGGGHKRHYRLIDFKRNKDAVEATFEGVKVANVNTVNVKPKAKRVGRYTGFTSKTKKAIITLTADSKAIELFATEAE